VPDQRSDLALMRAHAAGDPDAFGELVRRHRDRLWAVALRTTGDPETAADGLQDGLIAAFRRAGSFRGDAAVTTWLHRVVVNACLDRVRRAKVRAADPWPEHDLAARGPDPVSQRELALDLEAALRTLPAEQRAALVLVDMYGWPVGDAAEVLDCAPGTVKSRCSRGRARLVALLRDGGNQAAPDRVPPVTPSTGPPTTGPPTTAAPEGGDRT
jgi:RNA polymerase sigma-70 factor (ECF subfamily)